MAYTRKVSIEDNSQPFAKTLREIAGTKFSQAEIARFVGCTPQAIGSYMRGETIPRITDAQKIADFFGVSLDFLCGSYCEKKYTVKVVEEESDDSYFEVSVPHGSDSSAIERDFNMAVKYSQSGFYEDDKRNFDGYFDEIAGVRENVSGEQVFILYLEKLGYKVKPFNFDKEFEL